MSSFAERVACQRSDTMKSMVSKSFQKGFARTLNLAGTKEWPNISDSAKQDYLALRRDWENVGNTIQRECRKYAETRS